MPADGIPSCPFASNGDVGTSRLEELLLRLRSYASPNISARIKTFHLEEQRVAAWSQLSSCFCYDLHI